MSLIIICTIEGGIEVILVTYDATVTVVGVKAASRVA